MRTTYFQFEILVDYMERNGDIARIKPNPVGKVMMQRHWEELTRQLNSSGDGGMGPVRTTDQWRKVWSDFKNNTRKKASKIKRSPEEWLGNRRTCRRMFEARVMAIINNDTKAALDTISEPEETDNEYKSVSLPELVTAKSDTDSDIEDNASENEIIKIEEDYSIENYGISIDNRTEITDDLQRINVEQNAVQADMQKARETTSSTKNIGQKNYKIRQEKKSSQIFEQENIPPTNRKQRNSNEVGNNSINSTPIVDMIINSKVQGVRRRARGNMSNSIDDKDEKRTASRSAPNIALENNNLFDLTQNNQESVHQTGMQKYYLPVTTKNNVGVRNWPKNNPSTSGTGQKKPHACGLVANNEHKNTQKLALNNGQKYSISGSLPINYNSGVLTPNNTQNRNHFNLGQNKTRNNTEPGSLAPNKIQKNDAPAFLASNGNTIVQNKNNGERRALKNNGQRINGISNMLQDKKNNATVTSTQNNINSISEEDSTAKLNDATTSNDTNLTNNDVTINDNGSKNVQNRRRSAPERITRIKKRKINTVFDVEKEERELQREEREIQRQERQFQRELELHRLEIEKEEIKLKITGLEMIGRVLALAERFYLNRDLA